MSRADVPVAILDPMQILDQQIRATRIVAQQRPHLDQGLRVHAATFRGRAHFAAGATRISNRYHVGLHRFPIHPIFHSSSIRTVGPLKSGPPVFAQLSKWASSSGVLMLLKASIWSSKFTSTVASVPCH